MSATKPYFPVGSGVIHRAHGFGIVKSKPKGVRSPTIYVDFAKIGVRFVDPIDLHKAHPQQIA